MFYAFHVTRHALYVTRQQGEVQRGYERPGELRVHSGLGFGVWGLGFGIQGSGLDVQLRTRAARLPEPAPASNGFCQELVARAEENLSMRM